MNQRDSRPTHRALSSTQPTVSSAYASAMKAMTDKVKRTDGQRKSTDAQPRDILVEQLKQQVNELSNENQQLNLQMLQFTTEAEMNFKTSQQIEYLQVERLQHLKDYQDRVTELIRKNEELKQKKHEYQMLFENAQRQLQAYKNNEKGFMHKVELKKYEENAILHNSVQDLKQKIDLKDALIKKLERRIETIQLGKTSIQTEFEEYKTKHSMFKLQECEKQITTLRYQLDEKDRIYLKNLDEAQSNRMSREEQMTKRIQELIMKSNEYQNVIQQLTLDYKDLNVKYQQLRIKLDQEEKNHQYLRRKLSKQEETDRNYQREQRTISKLNLDQLSPTICSQIGEQSMRQSQLKQAIRECLEDMKANQPYQSPEKKYESKKRILSPSTLDKQSEIEAKLKLLNDRYENLIRQAQKETDLKTKALIRKQLLEIAEQIKEATKFDKKL